MGPKYLSLLYSISEKPLEYWSKHARRSGRIRKVVDVDLLENVIEIQDLEMPDGCDTSITCPREPFQLLEIELPILVIIMKNLDINFRLQLQVMDRLACSHRFLFTNADFEKNRNPNRIAFSRVKLKLEPNWNKLEFDLASLAKNALHRDYKATQRIEISANCRVRKVYFIDKHYGQEEVSPAEFYHGFLDTYMLKWGIHLAELSIQTENRKGKTGGAVDSAGETEEKNVEGNGGEAGPEDNHFLKKLRNTSDKLMDEFFANQCLRVGELEEFKSRARMKSYVIPKVVSSKQGQGQASNFFSRDICFEKADDVLGRFTETRIPTNRKSAESHASRCTTSSNLQENYGLHLKSMLQFKPPRSAFYCVVDRDSPQESNATAQESRKETEERTGATIKY